MKTELVYAMLRDGTCVLGKLYHRSNVPSDAISTWMPLTYANRTQAGLAAKKHGGEVIQRGRPFFVGLKNQKCDEPFDPTEGRTIWNSDGTDGPCLICPPPEGTVKS